MSELTHLLNSFILCNYLPPLNFRASSVLPDLEVTEEADIDERISTKPVRNRQSHGVSQYDLERAATWAMIGSNKGPGLNHRDGFQSDRKSGEESSHDDLTKNKTSEIDYKKVRYRN